jgi:protein-S-isoprenylcysteine O-methyltransferase Ste14
LSLERALMTTLNGRTMNLVAIPLIGLFMASIWLMLKPTFVSGSTYAVIAAVVVSTVAIAINAWQNAQAPTSTSEVIHDAETSRRV